MSDNPKISLDLKEYLVDMKREILEDSKARHENHETVTNTNFKALAQVSAANHKSMEDHARSTRWLLLAVATILGLGIAYLEWKGHKSESLHLTATINLDGNVPDGIAE